MARMAEMLQAHYRFRWDPTTKTLIDMDTETESDADFPMNLTDEDSDINDAPYPHHVDSTSESDPQLPALSSDSCESESETVLESSTHTAHAGAVTHTDTAIARCSPSSTAAATAATTVTATTASTSATATGTTATTATTTATTATITTTGITSPVTNTDSTERQLVDELMELMKNRLPDGWGREQCVTLTRLYSTTNRGERSKMHAFYDQICQQLQTQPKQTRSFLHRIRTTAQNHSPTIAQYFAKIKRTPAAPAVQGSLSERTRQRQRVINGLGKTMKKKIWASLRANPASNVPFPQLLCNYDLPPQRLDYDSYVTLDETGDPHQKPPLPDHAEVDLYKNRARIPEKWCFSISVSQFLIPGVKACDVPYVASGGGGGGGGARRLQGTLPVSSTS